jgi:hypothetical protein
MHIAYIGWGSLIWDYKNLPIHLNETECPWIKTNLKLPLEFSRISDKGNGRITLVIDTNGTLNNVYYAPLLSTTDKKQAIISLRRREKTNTKNIGYIDNITNEINSRLPIKIINDIKSWMKNNNIDIAIWTDIETNWESLKGKKFTNKDAFDYFTSINPSMQIKIFNYIYRTKIILHINTPFTKYYFHNLAKYADEIDTN